MNSNLIRAFALPLGATAVGLWLNAGTGDVAAQSADETPPTVEAVAPGAYPPTTSGAPEAAAVNTSIQVTFSEPVDLSTLSSATFVVKVGGVKVDGAVSYDEPSRTATFRPLGDLVSGSTHTVTLTKGIADPAGNHMAEAFEWSFATAFGGARDTVSPVAVAAVPAGGSNEVAVNTAVQLYFSEAMDARTINPETLLLDGGAAGTVVYDAPTRSASFYPARPLVPVAEHMFTLKAGATDLSGNSTTADASWQFRTGAAADTAPPAVTSVSPAGDSSPGQYSAHDLSVDFSEAVDARSIDEGTLLVNGTAALVSYDPVSRRLRSWYEWHPERTYQVTLRAGVRDLAGNERTADYTWSFRTAPAPDLGGGGGDYGSRPGCFVSSLLHE